MGYHRLFSFTVPISVIDAIKFSEYYWADKVQGARESELKWRVKENIVDTLISFIWLRLSPH